MAPVTQPETAAPADEAPLARRVRRHRSGAVVAGVAGGVAEHLAVPVLRVRVVFTLLCALGGAGVLAYGGLWAFCPIEPPGTARDVDGRDRLRGYGLVALGLALALVLSAVGEQISGWILGPLGIALVGAAVVWREADGATGRGRLSGRRERTRLLGGRGGVLRAVLGALLVAGGITAFLVGSLNGASAATGDGFVGAVRFGLLAATATLVGVVVLTVPWWMRLVRELSAERRERIRSEERAEIAAHLHDSVLQTLALIQRHTEVAGDETAREVRRLARRQERELRDWLYGEEAVDAADVACFAAALRTAAGEVEDAFAVTVEPVVVGDAAYDPRTAALVAAAREAMTNAAKHAGVEDVSVYAEVEDGTVSVFVRDRGKGFDPDDVPSDRHGLADSIRGRVERHGGTVRLRTALGEGTEVGLTMPRTVEASEVA